MPRKEITRVRDNEFCTLEIEIREKAEGKKCLSVCGTEGYILSEDDARSEAKDFWETYFEDERCGTNFGPFDIESAANYVLNVNGDYHGLDVVREENGKVFIATGCGQIRESLAEWFPEVKPFLKYHLNDMNPGCVHQRKLKQKPSVGTPCPECDYRYGTAWLYEPLPQCVFDFFDSLMPGIFYVS